MATRTDKNGTVWEVDAQGNPIRPVAQGGGQYGPDPVKVAAEQRAVDDQEFQRQQAILARQAAERANNNSAQSNAISAQSAALQQQKFQAELAQKGLMIGPNGQIIANPNGPVGGTPRKPMRQGDADKLAEQIDSYAYLKEALAGFQDDYAGNKITGELENWAQGTIGTGTPGQRDWWSSFRTADNLIRNSLFGASLTDGEKKAYEQTTVSPSMTPETVRENLKRRLEIARQALARRTGRLRATFNNEEIDAAVGEFADDFAVAGRKRDDDPMASLNMASPSTPTGGTGPDRTLPLMIGGGIDPNTPRKKLGTEKRYATDEDVAWQKKTEQLFEGGASLGELNAASVAAYGKPLPDQAAVQDWINRRDGVGKYKGNPNAYRKSLPTVGLPQSGIRSGFQRGFNKGVTWDIPGVGFSPGTAAATGANALSLGALEAIAPDAFTQMREENAGSAFTGDVAGMIGGTALLAKAGTGLAKKFAPSLLGGGKKAAFARSVAPDAAYGAAYGGITQGDPLTGAASALGGNLAGRGIAKGLGAIAKGVDDPAVQYLAQRDIPLSVGQVLGNRGVVGRIMNKLESLPVVGDLMANQRVQGLQAFEREALNDVLQPIGGRVAQGGAEGLEQAQGVVSDGFENALRGVNIPGDEQFVQETGEALARGSAIPDLGPKFRYAIDNRIGPMFEGGAVSGPELQQALQNLGSIRSSFAKEGPMGQFAADATSQIDDALTGLVGRQAPDVMPQYNAAKSAFSRLVPFENARISGINQPAITPAQLGRAVTSNTKNFGGRAAAARGGNLSDLIKYGQEVLPSTVPNSGTADRLGGIGAVLLPAALGGSAYGLSTMTDNPEVAIPLATLAALSTKTGQKAFQTAATKRPKAIRRASSLIGGRKAQQGLSGLVTAPLLVEDY